MRQDQKTRVIFRKWDNGDIIALFPDIPTHPGACLSYEHQGQHGGAQYKGVMQITIPAAEPEYRALQQELTHIGYILEIVDKK